VPNNFPPALSRAGLRRTATATVAAAVLISPLLVATPALAVPEFPITAVDFGPSTVNIGENIVGYFNDDVTLTEVDGFGICMSDYKNGLEIFTTAVGTAQAIASFGTLTGEIQGFEAGDVYTVAFYPNDGAGCAAPDLAAVGTISASITVGALPPPPVVECVGCITAAPITLKQGVAVDMIAPIVLGGTWDWSHQGSMYSGPQRSFDNGEIYPLAGLNFESVESPGVAPQLRIYGTPIYAVTFDSGLWVGNGIQWAEASLPITVTPAAGNSSVTLGLAAGSPVVGAPINVVMSGLKPGAAFSVTVRSTPVIVGSGTVAIDGVLAQTYAIPAGLAAGRHSVTLSSTLADGSVVNAVLWFTVSATGTLVSVSLTAPQLAATGAEAAPAVIVAGSLLLLGAAFAGASVYRRRQAA
jgi:hypothetical protein